jgi:hypothetical protein
LIMRFALGIAAIILLTVPVTAEAAAVSAPLSITVSPGALALVLNPSSVTEPCTVAGGTVVSTASTAGGDGNAVTFSMTGNITDFVINATTGVVTVVPAGVALQDCDASYTNIITATQP